MKQIFKSLTVLGLLCSGHMAHADSCRNFFAGAQRPPAQNRSIVQFGLNYGVSSGSGVYGLTTDGSVWFWPMLTPSAWKRQPLPALPASTDHSDRGIGQIVYMYGLGSDAHSTGYGAAGWYAKAKDGTMWYLSAQSRSWKSQIFPQLPAKSDSTPRQMLEAFPMLYAGAERAGWFALGDDETLWHLPFESARWRREPLPKLPLKADSTARKMMGISSITLAGYGSGWYVIADDQTLWFQSFYEPGKGWQSETFPRLPKKSDGTPRRLLQALPIAGAGPSSGWIGLADDQTFWRYGVIRSDGEPARWENPERYLGRIPALPQN